MREAPRDGHIDSTRALLRAPYTYISRTCRRLGADLFQARVLLRPITFVSGPDAARMFYESPHLVRHNAAPARIRRTLFGTGGVQGLDGDRHRARKQVMMSIMSPAGIDRLNALTADELRGLSRSWEATRPVPLFEAIAPALTRVACRWSGIDVDPDELPQRAGDLVSLFKDAAAIGPRHARSRAARRRSDCWARTIIEKCRAGLLTPPEGSACEVLSHAAADNAKPLASHVAGVELLNTLRPTVAVSVFIVHIAHALARHPDERPRLLGNHHRRTAFIREVRRFYPFFPCVIARASESFEWDGVVIPDRRRVVLDLYGTCHDPRAWERPDDFIPDRFLEAPIHAFGMIPQGGGEYLSNHRCAGEHATEQIMLVALDWLLHLRYRVPPQDDELDMGNPPALPRGGFVIEPLGAASAGEQGVDQSSRVPARQQ